MKIIDTKKLFLEKFAGTRFSPFFVCFGWKVQNLYSNFVLDFKNHVSFDLLLIKFGDNHIY